MDITRGIRDYHAANGAFEKAFVLKELFHEIDRYLARRQTPWAPTGRVAIVNDLYKCVVRELCDFFQVSVNLLPVKLSQVFQSQQAGMHRHNEEYLTIARREQSRLIFDGGAIRRWSPARGFALAETRNNPELGMDGDRADSPQAVEGEAGYVMAPWDAIYVAKHNDTRFHSQYLSGERVVCAGDLVIRHGRLKRVSNNSGHYQPPAEQLVPLLWCFQKNGVSISSVQVVVVEDMDHCYMCLAPELMRTGGRARPANAIRYEQTGPNGGVWQIQH